MAEASSKIKDPFINRFAPYFLPLYSAVSLISWMPHPFEQVYQVLNEGTLALIFRIVLGALFVVYMGLICLANKKMPPWRYTALFVLIIAYLGILILIQDKQYVYDASKDPITVTTTFSAKFYLGWAYSAFMAYCLLFVLPLAKTHRKIQYLPFLIFWVAMGFVFIGYSVATQFDIYKGLLTWKAANKWEYDVHSFFANKNPFGAALFGSFVASIVLAQQLKMGGRIPFWIIALAFFAETVFIRCSTAYVSELVVIVVLYFAGCIQGINKHPGVAWSFLSLGLLGLVGLVALLTIPSFYESNKLFSKFRDVIISPDYSGRVNIWSKYLATFTLKSSVFGWGSLGRFIVGTVVEGVPNDHPTENAYLDVYTAGGIVFLAFYLWVLAHTFKTIWQSKKVNQGLFAGLFALFFGCLVYGITESNHYVFSSSSMTFVASFLIAAVPATMNKSKE